MELCSCGVVYVYSGVVVESWIRGIVELLICGVVKLWIVELCSGCAVELWSGGVVELCSCGVVKLYNH